MISLRPITPENWRICISLNIREDQKQFLSSNLNSLAMAYVYKEMRPRAIYNENEMVGFLMYAVDPSDNLPYMNRYMVDEKFQGKGYGTAALLLLIENLKAEGFKSLDILHKPYNYDAIRLYEKLGFKRIEETLGDDVISSLEW